MQKRKVAYSFLCGILVFLVVLLVLIQAFDVPFWWAFGIGNNEDHWWIISLSPENPKLGENVTIGVAEGIHNIYLIDNATITISHHGLKPITVQTNSAGEASFLYPGDPTVIRATKQWGDSFNNSVVNSMYVVIPKTPIVWVSNCLVAISGSIISGLFAGLLIYSVEKKRSIRK